MCNNDLCCCLRAGCDAFLDIVPKGWPSDGMLTCVTTGQVHLKQCITQHELCNVISSPDTWPVRQYSGKSRPNFYSAGAKSCPPYRKQNSSTLSICIPRPHLGQQPRTMAASLTDNGLPYTQPVCQNCQTSTTPLWRRDEAGSVLCNACGLFLKLHGRARPISLKTDVIKSRNRVKSAGQVPKKKVAFKADIRGAPAADDVSSHHSTQTACQPRHPK